MPEIPLDDSVLAGVRPPRDPERGMRFAKLVFGPLVLLLFAVFLVFYVFFSATVVAGPSMLETLRPGDRLLVTKSYDSPSRGDIVVATIAGEHGDPDVVIKRVVAIPGDTVEIRKDVAFVNGKEEPNPGLQWIPGEGEDVPPQILRDDEVFLMGDNRPLSWDSRFVGAVPLEDVQGKATFIFAPIQRMGPVHR
ncbi:MAG: signal peptidase I [Coriobacteriales bacterium]|nr:signal peptidase I [Coriobacteriales bacterium]